MPISISFSKPSLPSIFFTFVKSHPNYCDLSDRACVGLPPQSHMTLEHKCHTRSGLMSSGLNRMKHKQAHGHTNGVTNGNAEIVTNGKAANGHTVNGDL